MCEFVQKNYSGNIWATSKVPVKDTAVSQLAKEKTWLIKGDATGSAIAFHSLLYLILTYNLMFILKGYIRTDKHWLNLLLSIKKNAGGYAKEYKFCLSPHLLLSSVFSQIRC